MIQMLLAGTKLGPYEIVSQLGEGGMGEVYRARDARLGRDVAVKVLPEAFSDDRERVHRFEQEARTAGMLNHPNIVAVYDIGTHQGRLYLVTELLEGETLRSRLEGGALPYSKALSFAQQVAQGLAAAHAKGITHRDVKPENLFVASDGHIKILDFGLAKLEMPGTAGTSRGPEPTMIGMVLGTSGYLSPEQAKGQPSDARSDIFSLGAVLYEMSSGRRAFDAPTQAETVALILRNDPPPADVPPSLQKLIQRCLEKVPAERFQSANDLGFAIEAVNGSFTSTSATAPMRVARSRGRLPIPWIVATLAVLVAVTALAVSYFRHPASDSRDARAVQFAFTLPPNLAFSDTGLFVDWPVVSPDGKTILFGAGKGDKAGLGTRPLDSLKAQLLPGTEGGYASFWSPDNQSIAFFSHGKLLKIAAAGGPVQTLGEAPAPRGGAWSSSGAIVFSPEGVNGKGLVEVPANGGEAQPFIKLDASRGESMLGWPQFLPGGQILYFVQSAKADIRGIYVAAADGKNPKMILRCDTAARYAQGYLLFLRQDTLVAQRFDTGKSELLGEPMPLAEQVGQYAISAVSYFTVSQNGVLAYRVDDSALKTQFTWFDRDGRQTGVAGEPGEYTNPRLSPDGKKVVFARMDPQVKTRDLWMMDLARGSSTRLTFDKSDDTNPVWSADGSKVLFTSDRLGQRDIFLKAANGLGPEELISKAGGPKNVNDWSMDGRYAVFDTSSESGVFSLPMFGDRQPALLARGRSSQLSPDGKWIAYNSTESGTPEVYVQSFPQLTGKWQVSNNSGMEAAWRADGKELYYLENGKMMAVDIKASASGFEAGVPRLLFDTHAVRTTGRNRYVAAADGKRFLVLRQLDPDTTSAMVVMVNWVERLGRH